MDPTDIAGLASRGIDLAGVLIIVGGAVVTTVIATRQWRRDGGFSDAYRTYRQGLGRAILLGLEFLVAADIIRTVAVSPTFSSVGVLALIVLIRTFLSFSLQLEIEGRLPWQRRSADEPPARRAA